MPSPSEAIDTFLLGMRGTLTDQWRKPEVRASSMPFCPIIFSLNSGWGQLEYASDFYFKAGTVIHDLTQQWAARSETGQAMLWGDWKCSACGKVRHKHCLKPAEACKCKANDQEWLYNEVELTFKGLSGHIDTILYVGKIDGVDSYVIVDYKTATTQYGRLTTQKFPYRGNVLQISVYSYIMKELYGLNIVGWGLVYLDRSRPIRSPRDYHLSFQNWTEKNHKRMGRKLTYVQSAAGLAQKMWDRLHERIEKPGKKQVRQLLEARPCKTQQNWEEWMAAGWEREFEMADRVCPHLEHCLCGGKKMEKHFDKVIDELLESYNVEE